MWSLTATKAGLASQQMVASYNRQTYAGSWMACFAMRVSWLELCPCGECHCNQIQDVYFVMQSRHDYA